MKQEIIHSTYIPEGYTSQLNLIETQETIKKIKDFFQKSLANNLNLIRVSAPMFVKSGSGLNDYLSGTEKPVSFNFLEEKNLDNTAEIVHSLAKWKRYALKRYNIPVHKGIYTDMNAIRSFEITDNTHSIYVDQWDWELVIDENDLNEDFLKTVVKKIYKSFLDLEKYMKELFPEYKEFLSKDIEFIHSQELEDMYPDKTPEEREKIITKKYGSVFIMAIGDKLKSGKKHGDRSPDYDDWSLNGDIIIWNDILNDALELSSMGIRVSPQKLEEQLKKSNNEDRKTLTYHKELLENKLPLTIGGGIGQSRICMLFMKKAHIGEVQASVWPVETEKLCKKHGIILL